MVARLDRRCLGQKLEGEVEEPDARHLRQAGLLIGVSMLLRAVTSTSQFRSNHELGCLVAPSSHDFVSQAELVRVADSGIQLGLVGMEIRVRKVGRPYGQS